MNPLAKSEISWDCQFIILRDFLKSLFIAKSVNSYKSPRPFHTAFDVGRKKFNTEFLPLLLPLPPRMKEKAGYSSKFLVGREPSKFKTCFYNKAPASPSQYFQYENFWSHA